MSRPNAAPAAPSPSPAGPRVPVVLAGLAIGLVGGLAGWASAAAQEPPARAHEERPLADEPGGPPAVSMRASASPAAGEQLNRGVEALHDFWYVEARERFREAQRLEPGFVLAHWAEALSHHYPFGYSGGDPDEMRAALDRLAPTPGARAELARTERERRYLAAIEILAGEGTEQERRKGFARAMHELAEAYPDDLEAWAFYALSLFGTARNIRSVPEIRDEVARATAYVLERAPRHPGALHYRIHALDTPPTAERALEAARTYETLPTEASHAIHMPSHIYLQLGLWEDVVAANRRAWAASERWVEETGRAAADRDWHAADFLHYALLQQGRVAGARRWTEEARRVAEELDSGTARWFHAAWSARERVETAAWGTGPLPTSGYEGRDELLAAGIDAVHSGDHERAREILVRMEARRERARENAGSAMDPVGRWEVTRKELQAVIAAAADDLSRARRLLAEAIALQDEIPPPNETPDPVLPPHELLGELLLDAGRPSEAAAAFRKSIDMRQGRARSLIGLARASAAAGDDEAAASAWRRLLARWEAADPDRPELAEAKVFLQSFPDRER